LQTASAVITAKSTRRSSFFLFYLNQSGGL